jgi:hypothetical protein
MHATCLTPSFVFKLIGPVILGESEAINYEAIGCIISFIALFLPFSWVQISSVLSRVVIHYSFLKKRNQDSHQRKQWLKLKFICPNLYVLKFKMKTGGRKIWTEWGMGASNLIFVNCNMLLTSGRLLAVQQRTGRRKSSLLKI